MDRNTAEALIRQYFQSWLEQDIALFLSIVSPGIRVAECYGPIYCGTDEVTRWFDDWHSGPGKGQVTRWDILTMQYDEQQKMAAVEWDFECIYDGNLGTFLGASVFCFDETNITRIHEYKMEKAQYRPYRSQ
ncbi:MAG: nuclear transport factor 2 family protein [Anaerolineae bacterium]